MRSGRRATRGRRALLRCHPFQPGTQVVELIVPEDAVVLQPTDDYGWGQTKLLCEIRDCARCEVGGKGPCTGVLIG